MLTNANGIRISGCLAGLALLCLAVAGLSFGPAVGQEDAPATAVIRAQARADQALQATIALEEKQVAVKRAAVKVADAQKQLAEARLKVLRTRVSAAQAAEANEKRKLEVSERLGVAVTQGDLEEARARYVAATLLRQEAEETLAVGEAEVALEAARRELAQAELEEAELRLKQLKERLEKKER